MLKLKLKNYALEILFFLSISSESVKVHKLDRFYSNFFMRSKLGMKRQRSRENLDNPKLLSKRIEPCKH